METWKSVSYVIGISLIILLLSKSCEFIFKGKQDEKENILKTELYLSDSLKLSIKKLNLNKLQHDNSDTLLHGKLLPLTVIDDSIVFRESIYKQFDTILTSIDINEVNSFVLIHHQSKIVGQYSSNSNALQDFVDVYLIRAKTLKTYKSMRIYGGEPPLNIRERAGRIGNHYGSFVTIDEIQQVLQEQVLNF